MWRVVGAPGREEGERGGDLCGWDRLQLAGTKSNDRERSGGAWGWGGGRGAMCESCDVSL